MAEFCTLHHDNIIETVDLVQHENKAWCKVMEFCPGVDLYATIKKGHMSPSEVGECLHSQGVAHRDIKTGVVILWHAGHLKVCLLSPLSPMIRKCHTSDSIILMNFWSSTIVSIFKKCCGTLHRRLTHSTWHTPKHTHPTCSKTHTRTSSEAHSISSSTPYSSKDHTKELHTSMSLLSSSFRDAGLVGCYLLNLHVWSRSSVP